MSGLRVQRLTRFVWVQVALVTAVLVLSLGFCVMSSHLADGHHATSLDLCTGLVLVLPAALIFGRPRLTGFAMLEPVPLVSTPFIHLVDPPPRTA